MNHNTKIALVGLVLSLAISQNATIAGDWPMFRGPGGRSIGQATDLPLEWSVVDGKNIAWQADLPGRGVSGPIVVAGKVFVTASSGPNRDRLHVVSFDADTGKQLWHRQFWATGMSLCHETSANAAPTPASDGERIFAFFSSNDLMALDLDGNLLWMRGLELDYPGAGNALGMSSSPVVLGDVVVVQSEAQGTSFVAALDRRDGATRWDIERPNVASNWCSPIAIETEFTIDKQPAIVLQSPDGIDLHRADNGELLLHIETACESIPSLTFDKHLYAPSNGIQVFDILSAGLEDKGQPIWQESKLQPGSSSAVVSEGQVFVISRAGVLSCGSLETKKVWKLRLGGRFWSTPVLVGNHLYCINGEGKSFVVALGEPGEKGRIVAENEFGEDVLGSPAVADNGLFVRSHTHLWKIAK